MSALKAGFSRVNSGFGLMLLGLSLTGCMEQQLSPSDDVPFHPNQVVVGIDSEAMGDDRQALFASFGLTELR